MIMRLRDTRACPTSIKAIKSASFRMSIFRIVMLSCIGRKMIYSLMQFAIVDMSEIFRNSRVKFTVRSIVFYNISYFKKW